LRYVLDASVAVAALRVGEPFHAEALRRCTPLFAGRDEIVVPAIFDFEVTAALVRRGIDPLRVEAFFTRHLTARERVAIGTRYSRAIRRIIGVTRLRAADSLYVWVAAREGLDLVTTDDEILARATHVGVTAVRP
jgi:predicted nucleic acid-binding protein